MQIVDEMGRYQMVCLTFAQAEVADSQTAAALLPCEVHGGVALDVLGYVMPWQGWVVGVSVNLSAAGTAGSLAVVPTIDTVAATDPAVTVTTAATGSDKCKRDRNPFGANAVIGAKVTTDGTWNGTASDLLAQVWVIVKVAGI